MRWKPKIQKDWHNWFAWYPIYLSDGTKVWLETVERTLEYSTYDVWPHYRLKEKNATEARGSYF